MEYDNLRTIDLNIEDLGDDEPITSEPNQSIDNPELTQLSQNEEPFTEQNTNTDDLTTELLRLKGITDPTKIKVQDDSGAIVEVAWDLLSRDEQLSVLMMENDDPETRLDEEEIKLINEIREAGLNPSDYIRNLQEDAINQLNTPRQYQIDELTDDELFALDLMDKVGDSITDEELEDAIAKAKENADLYAKQVEALRKIYKNKEDEHKAKQQQALQAEEDQRYQEFANTVLDQIQAFSQNSGLEVTLSNDDMNDLANFMLTRDETGMTDFGKMINDPKTFTQVAFWALKGPEILNEFQTLMQEQFKRGYTLGQKGYSTQQNRVTVLQPKQNSHNSLEIDLNDESYLEY